MRIDRGTKQKRKKRGGAIGSANGITAALIAGMPYAPMVDPHCAILFLPVSPSLALLGSPTSFFLTLPISHLTNSGRLHELTRPEITSSISKISRKMATAVCASACSITSIAASASAQRSVGSGAAVKASILPGKSLRQTKLTHSTVAKSSSESAGSPAPPAPPPATPKAERPIWFPGSTPPEWLDGSLPADFGFDPLGLGELRSPPLSSKDEVQESSRSDPDLLKWFVQAEIVHCRWAMLGAVGIFVPELLTKIGVLNTPSWYTAGEAQYFADPTTLFVAELLFMGWAEGRRWADIIKPGSVNTDPVFPQYKLTGTDVGYPGGFWFDPLGFGKGGEDKIKELRTKEIKNGRLAMLAVLGASFQAVYTGTGPIDNLFAHIADPGHATIFAAINK